MTGDRYDGRPLLLILESWVLDCIDELPDGKRQAIADLVRGAFGGGDDWRAALRRALEVDRTHEALIVAEWAREPDGRQRSAEEFAQGLVDRDFAHLLEDA